LWLRQEEDRPFGHYRFLYLPEGSGSLPSRSPLAERPEDPFVLAYFQIDPDGEVTSPLWPVDAERAAETLGWRMDAEQIAQRDEILGVLAELVLQRSERPVPAQDAGTTVSLEGAGRTLARWRQAGPTDLLSQLNRGPASRAARTTKVQQSQAANVLDFTREGPAFGGGAESVRRPTLAVVDVSLEPMVGRPLDVSTLMLYRTVVIEDRAFRQGMVIDGELLVGWLADRVLAQPAAEGRGSLERAPVPGALEVEWDRVGERGAAEAAVPAEAPPSLAFRHRFAEPFASVASRARLDPLPASSTAVYIYSLAALLVLASTFGLWALERTVAARLRFAERQSNFVSAVTHELKTPLTAIRMHGEMLRDGVVPSEAKRQGYYRVLTAEAERLSRLIHNVLEVSQLEKQTRRFDLEPGDPRVVLHEVAEVLTPHARQLGFEIRVEDDGPADTVFDRDALAQVIFNLVDNALKYAGAAEEKTVVLSSENVGREIRLSVADRGPGVPRQQIREVFEPFYRGESEMTRTAQGTGIGLSIVRQLVQPMGGSVRGRNRQGGGFAVEIRLPARVDFAAAEPGELSYG
ncbi:MAG: HAMP domain-containing sensor histidine kinase, partial [Acidobacteriota bacterium]